MMMKKVKKVKKEKREKKKVVMVKKRKKKRMRKKRMKIQLQFQMISQPDQKLKIDISFIMRLLKVNTTKLKLIVS